MVYFFRDEGGAGIGAGKVTEDLFGDLGGVELVRSCALRRGERVLLIESSKRDNMHGYVVFEEYNDKSYIP